MSFYSDQAAEFQQMAQGIQTRLTNEGRTMDDAAYSLLEKQRDMLLDQTNAMIDADIKGTLAQLKADEPRIKACTASLVQAVKNVKTFDQFAAIVGAGVELAVAIVSANPGSIAAAVLGAEKAVADAISKPKEMPARKAGTAAKAGEDSGLAIAASEEPEP
jgi:hypothetical protein